jgi:hypothetical protein
MSERRRHDQRRQAYPRMAPAPYYPDEAYDAEYDDWDEPRMRRPRLVSPARVMLTLLVLVAGVVALYGFLDRTPLQLTIIIVGLGLLGVALLLLSLSLARAAAQLGRYGSGGKALFAALIGGFAILGAAGALSGAIVLAMLTA